MIHHHHERSDGSGDPDGLKDDQIPITVRIMSVVDVYDSLTTTRPYRIALSSAEAIEVLREEVAKGLRDADVLAQLEALLREDGPPPHRPSRTVPNLCWAFNRPRAPAYCFSNTL